MGAASMQPKVSVIFPIYNNEKYLENCIRSVMNQSLKDIELILIDDGSRDSAPAICDRLASEDSRIMVVHKQNEGSAAGRNQGIDMASGEYVAFVESDDFVAPDMYEKLYLRAKETQADIVKCGYYCTEGGHKFEVPAIYSVASDKDVFRVKDKPVIFMCHASIWAGIYKRDFLNQHQLRCIVTPSATYSDFSWMAMTYAHSERITIVHEALYFYNYENPLSSRVRQGEKCYYKPFHCLQANRILREVGILEDVIEEIGYQEYRTCVAHARNIQTELRQTYFEKIKAVLEDLANAGIQYKRFAFWEKYAAKAILKDQPKHFYEIILLEFKLMKLLAKGGATRNLLWKIKSVMKKSAMQQG